MSHMTVSIDPYVGMNLHVLPQTNALRALHAIIRDRHATREDFRFGSSRIIQLLIEAGLELLPFEDRDVETPVGEIYEGARLSVPICGVSIARAGESMEADLRAVCPSIRMGKILIQRDRVTKLPRLYYSALPKDIAKCHVLLLDPTLATGGTALAAIQVLPDAGVAQQNIIFINLLAVPEGISVVCEHFPEVRLVTSAVDERLNDDAYMMPGIGDFGGRFFGTDA